MSRVCCASVSLWRPVRSALGSALSSHKGRLCNDCGRCLLLGNACVSLVHCLRFSTMSNRGDEVDRVSRRRLWLVILAFSGATLAGAYEFKAIGARTCAGELTDRDHHADSRRGIRLEECLKLDRARMCVDAAQGPMASAWLGHAPPPADDRERTS